MKLKHVQKLKLSLGYFSSNIPEADRTGLQVRQRKSEDDSEQLSCSTSNGVKWHGTGDSELQQYTKVMLLVRNKRNGRTALVEPQQVYRFLPANLSTSTSYAVQAVTNARGEKRALNQSMYQEFGSNAKKRRVADTKKLNTTVTQQEVKQAAANSVKRMEQQQQQEKQPNNPAAQLLPPHNPAATDPALIYSIESLCPSSLSPALQPQADEFAASTPEQWANWKQQAALPQIVLYRLQHMPRDNQLRAMFCTRLAMLLHMRKMYALTYKQVNRKTPLPDTPDAVAEHLVANYSVPVSSESSSQHRALPQVIKDKQLVHIIILCLILDGFTTELQGLLQEFRLSRERLKKLLACIGCDVVSEKIGTATCQVAKLKAPLKLPK